MGKLGCPPLYIARGPPPWINRHITLCVGRLSHSDLLAQFSCKAYGGSGVSPLCLEKGKQPVRGRYTPRSAHVCSNGSVPLGPTDTSSFAWAGSRIATYWPNSHARPMGEVGFLPLYIVRGRSPCPNRHVILCVCRPLHRHLQAQF